MVHASKSFQNYAISMITNTQNLKFKLKKDSLIYSKESFYSAFTIYVI